MASVAVRTGMARKTIMVTVWLLGGWLAMSCSNPGEDVRVTLCKDLAAGLLSDPPSLVWKDIGTEARRSEQLIVTLKFTAEDPTDGRVKPMRAGCYYRYNAVDDTALTLADPMSAYSTSPYSVTLNDQTIGNPRLAEAIKQAMLKQGRAFLDRARQGIEEATETVRSQFGG